MWRGVKNALKENTFWAQQITEEIMQELNGASVVPSYIN